MKQTCSKICPEGIDFECTEKMGHKSDLHIARGMEKDILALWSDERVYYNYKQDLNKRFKKEK